MLRGRYGADRQVPSTRRRLKYLEYDSMPLNAVPLHLSRHCIPSVISL